MICTVTTSITALLLTAATCADDGARHSARCNLHTCATSIHTIVHANSRLLDAAGNSERVDEEGRRKEKKKEKKTGQHFAEHYICSQGLLDNHVRTASQSSRTQHKCVR